VQCISFAAGSSDSETPLLFLNSHTTTRNDLSKPEQTKTAKRCEASKGCCLVLEPKMSFRVFVLGVTRRSLTAAVLLLAACCLPLLAAVASDVVSHHGCPCYFPATP